MFYVVFWPGGRGEFVQRLAGALGVLDQPEAHLLLVVLGAVVQLGSLIAAQLDGAQFAEQRLI